ncbi:MAG: tetratricopeptide repeat protein, partial [Rhodothermales bacterium]
VGAEQKFGEVINLATPLQDEARLWLARTLIAAGAYDEAKDHLTTSLAREDLSNRWAPQLHLALGELHVQQGAFEDAALELEAGIEEVRDKRLEGRAWYLLGQVLETLGRYEQAVGAYDNVERTHPRYELSYAAQYSSVRVRGIHLDPDEALRRLRRMERDDKNYSNRFELAYLRGRIYQADGYANDAWDLYHDILYDSDEQIGDIRGRVHYALGELYRDQYRDYLNAAAHFDTARTAIAAPRSTVTTSRSQPQYAPEAIQDAERQSEMFGSFAGVRREIAKMDSLLALGELDDEEFADRILAIRKDLAREQAEMQRRAEQLQAQRGFQAAGAQTADRQAQAQQAAGSSEAGFLFHRDPVRVQEARMNFLVTWGERPHVPNWRRIDAVSGSAGETFASGEGAPRPIRGTDPDGGESPLPPLDYSDVPRDSLSRAAMLAERALARYELANVLFLAMNRPDSAATWYRLVIEEDEGEEVAQRAFYALAEVHRSLGDSASANRLYEQVLQDYPESDFAGRVREQLGIRQDVPSDTLALAMEAYEHATQRWRRGRYSEALNDMIVVAADFRQTEAAPKSLLAAGQIFLEWAARDSLEVFGPIPLAVSDSILVMAGLIEEVPDTPPIELEVDVAADSTAAGEVIPNEDPVADPALAPPDTSRQALLPGVAPPKKGDALSAPDESQLIPPVPDPAEAAAAEEPSKRILTEYMGAEQDTLEVPITDSLEVPVVDDVSPLQRAVDDAPIRQDTLTLTPAFQDTVEVAPLVEDTLTTAGAEIVMEESAAGVSAELSPVPDTAAAAFPLPDSALAVSSIPPPEPVVEEGLTLTDLYAGVRDLYPNTPYSRLATTLLSVLQDRRKELDALADSLARLAADSLRQEPDSLPDSLLASAADSLVSGAPDVLHEAVPADEIPADSMAVMAAKADSSAALAVSPEGDLAGSVSPPAGASSDRAVPPADTLATSQSPPEAAIPTGNDAVHGEGGIRRELGGYTLILGMNVNREPMEALAEKYAGLGFRTDVLVETAGQTQIYRAALGHFASQREAGIFLNEHITQIEEGVQLSRVTPPEQ